jgi:hypothetical protein
VVPASWVETISKKASKAMATAFTMKKFDMAKIEQTIKD